LWCFLFYVVIVHICVNECFKEWKLYNEWVSMDMSNIYEFCTKQKKYVFQTQCLAIKFSISLFVNTLNDFLFCLEPHYIQIIYFSISDSPQFFNWNIWIIYTQNLLDNIVYMFILHRILTLKGIMILESLIKFVFDNKITNILINSIKIMVLGAVTQMEFLSIEII